MNSLSFYIETFGCQMNKGDSELMTRSFIRSGFVPAADEKAADILVFNTCSVRRHAENRALSRIRSARAPSGGSRRPIMVVAGCMAQRIGVSLIEKKLADLIIGPYLSPAAGRLVRDYLSGGQNVYLSQSPADFIGRIDESCAAVKDTHPWHKWVTITHGCENFCAYCIVPSVRGPLISIGSGRILDYVRLCADNGIKEITLLGQNVNQYGTDNGDIPFSKLLERTAAIPGIARINFLTSHPMDFSTEIIDVIAEHENISRAVHLPPQSGSDRVLGLMNRKYTMSHYRAIATYLERRLGTYSLSTDLIVGYPGETIEDFTHTLDAVREFRFDDAFTYAYSPREGTSAFSLEETISAEEKTERLQQLIKIQRAISREKLISRINCTEEIIVEGCSKKSSREVMGKTLLNHPVVIPGGLQDIGNKLMITIHGIRGSTLYGERIA